MTTDIDTEILFSIAGMLKKSYIRDDKEDPWFNSPFAWIKTRPSRQIGKIGEQLVSAWCTEKGFQVSKSGDTECDLIINNHRVEVKLSTLWETGGYTFQQIRDQNYGYAMFLGISPLSAHCWLVPKDILKQYVIGHLPQHTGKKGTDTFWLSFPVTNPPDWLVPYGGSLAETYKVLQQYFM